MTNSRLLWGTWYISETYIVVRFSFFYLFIFYVVIVYGGLVLRLSCKYSHVHASYYHM